MNKIRFIYILLLLLFVASCQHRPLVEMQDLHYIRVYLNDDIKNITSGVYNPSLSSPTFEYPKVFRVALCDVNSGDIVAERYLQNSGRDNNGYYLDGYITAPPGNYNLFGYNFDTESTHVLHKDNFYDALAYTNGVSEQYLARLPQWVRANNSQGLANTIYYEPDHLFIISEENYRVSYTGADTLKAPNGGNFKAESLVYSYYIQMEIEGAKYVNGISAVLSGMVESTTIHNTAITTLNGIKVYFDMMTSQENSNGIAYLYTTFNTFGKLKTEESLLNIVFELISADGRKQTENLDITPIFESEEAKNNQWILLNYKVKITPPPPIEGDEGGFKPGITDWEDEQEDIII